jgi:hypothetical protein
MKPYPIESSLLAQLTDSAKPARKFSLSSECAVIVLTRAVRALNRTPAESFEDLTTRRECAAILVFLRLEIQRETMLPHE